MFELLVGKSCLSYKGTCHVILLAKLYDMYLYKRFRENFQGTQKRVRINYGKRAIRVRVIEGLLCLSPIFGPTMQKFYKLYTCCAPSKKKKKKKEKERKKEKKNKVGPDYRWAYADSEGPDQPAHPLSLIRAFTAR